MFSFVDHCYVQTAPCKMEAMQKTLPEISLYYSYNCSQQASPKVHGLSFKAHGLFCTYRGTKTGRHTL